MDELTTRYRQLSLELSFAQKIIKELSFYAKTVPHQCPVHKQISENLVSARQLRSDIKNDINAIADNELKMQFKITIR